MITVMFLILNYHWAKSMTGCGSDYDWYVLLGCIGFDQLFWLFIAKWKGWFNG